MTKYTIYKAFEKKFPFQIWKIVADTSTQLLGVELRGDGTQHAILYVLDFQGNLLLENLQLPEKEWTLEALQHQTIVLKRVGDSHPVKEGIHLLDIQGQTRYLSHEYTWVDTYLHYLKVRHRSLQSGFEEYIDIRDAKKVRQTSPIPEEFCTAVKMPIPYTGKLPDYLPHILPPDQADIPWVSRAHDKLIWSYHHKDGQHYHLNLCISDTSKLLYEQRLLTDMPKMIPQPYFQVGNQIFLMSYNKQEIVSYLV
ncbi:hypothetical protein [Sphingobacterium suaedae]|uniref:DUF4905 domain-containing protein n=1 Tax=Sphingobacterium suaedae TaxID=1686402 RepID=A0ABW5KCV3_9SPHI